MLLLDGFAADIDIVAPNGVESYTMPDDEDNFIEVITPSNAPGMIVVHYYQRCECVKTQVYNKDLEKLDEIINAEIKKIYGDVYEW